MGTLLLGSECRFPFRRVVLYVWMQAEALRDMLEWTQGDGDAQEGLQQRLAVERSQFFVEPQGV